MPITELPDQIDWDAIVVLARKHTVLGIIIESIHFLPERLYPSASMSAKMNKFAIKLIQSNIGIDQRVGKLVTFFGEYGIKGVLLKGQGIARNYRLPQMRQTGDIDYYVGESQYQEAIRLIRNHLLSDGGYCSEDNQHFCFTLDGVTVEIHRIATEVYSLFKKRRVQEWIIDELEFSPNRVVESIGNTSVILPSTYFNTIYVFYHGLCHLITEGIGLRQLCDWAMIFHAHGDEIDRKQLAADLSRFGLTRAWKLFAYIVVEYLGVAKHKMPLYDSKVGETAEKLLEMIIVGGNFGRYLHLNNASRGIPLGFQNQFAKFRYALNYLLYTFPVLPAEATSFYFYRLRLAVKTLLGQVGVRKVKN